jgi:2-hydroxy-3-keto-5-methylthiopentenyl-1-phosphate phosphatase
MRTAVLLDFDGTITMRDSSELALRRFAHGRWEEYDEMLDRGEIGLEDCMKRQFSLVEAMPEEITDYLDGVVEVREDFVSLFDVLSKKACHVGVVSAGLDFFIEHLLKKILDTKYLEITTGRAVWKDGVVHFSFPAIRNEGALDFKQDTVIEVRKRYGSVIYIGDGSSDYNSARASDLVYAVEGSRLALLCEKESLPYRTFSSFNEVENNIYKFL